MRKQGVRLLLSLTLLTALAASFQTYRFDQSIDAARAGTALATADFGDALSKVADLRNAQSAYFAPDSAFWMRRATEVSAQLQAQLTTARGQARTPAGTSHIDAATTALGDLMNADRRARVHIQEDQRGIAADVLFDEGATIAQQITGELIGARDAEVDQAGATAARLTQYRLATTVGGMVIMFVLAVVASIFSRAQAPARSEAEQVAQMIRDLPPPLKVTPSSARPVAPSDGPTSPASVPEPASATTTAATLSASRSAVNLPDMAELCVDLARVIDGRDVPALLQRAAGLLQANGVIVWVCDTQATTLQPMLAFGYPDQMLRKLGTLDAMGENVTSLAFRSVRPQSRTGASGQPGAIAVPLVTASGCAGVLSAETRDARPGPDAVALARIVAAQLATLIAPTDAAAQAAQA